MKYKFIPASLALLVGVFLFSCADTRADQTPGADADAVRTEAVATFASSLTESLPAPLTPFPTQTASPAATETALSTTPEPSPTSNPCFNLLYIEDVTIQDGTRMRPGEKFTKTWLVQNTGGCAWRPGFTFRHVGGDSMRGSAVTLTEAIPTGAKRQISVELVVPGGINGVIESAWQMADENGIFFGDTLFVKIVTGDATTPAVTNTP